MKVREDTALGRCEFCQYDDVKEVHIVTFERDDTILLLCEDCLSSTRRLLEILDIKEAEA